MTLLSHRTTRKRAALFIDLSRAFDVVNHCILKQRLLNIVLSEKAVGWFENYLNDKIQCVTFDGVSQGSGLGPLLFTMYINVLGLSVANI